MDENGGFEVGNDQIMHPFDGDGMAPTPGEMWRHIVASLSIVASRYGFSMFFSQRYFTKITTSKTVNVKARDLESLLEVLTISLCSCIKLSHKQRTMDKISHRGSISPVIVLMLWLFEPWSSVQPFHHAFLCFGSMAFANFADRSWI